MDLSSILSQRIPDFDVSFNSPYVTFANSRGLNVSHEEILVSTVANFLSKLGESSTLLLAAKQPLSRYTGYLDPLIRRSKGKQLFGLDFSDELIKSSSERFEENLTSTILQLVCSVTSY